MQGDDETDMARRRRWAGAALASVIAYVMGQAFAYSPIEVYSQEEILSAMMSPLGISDPAAGR
ncbi:MAG: hypothetical protein MRY64_07265 [Hyphomonadaceae bacterium]|nr:hypothetical protein [Hyphomonadaceae bacterium]